MQNLKQNVQAFPTRVGCLTIACNQDISRVERAFVNLKENLANFSNKGWMLEITCNQNISSKLKGFLLN